MTRKTKKKVINQKESDELLLESLNFWLSKFDSLSAELDVLEKSDAKFDLGFSAKVDEMGRKIEEAAGHLNSEMTNCKRNRKLWEATLKEIP